MSDGQTKEINVGKEVILSVGAIGSPKILELSGVGNSKLLFSVLFSAFYSYFKRILHNAGVEPVLNLPTVGENLAGQFSLFYLYMVIISTFYFG